VNEQRVAKQKEHFHSLAEWSAYLEGLEDGRAAAAPAQPAGELRTLLKEYLDGGHSAEGGGHWSCGCDLCERTRAALQRERVRGCSGTK
jgi:hypothetical protein